MAITFEQHVTTRKVAKVRIGGKALRLDRQIQKIERILGRAKNPDRGGQSPAEWIGWIGSEYLEARGVIAKKEEPITIRREYGGSYASGFYDTQITDWHLTSIADVERCLKELRDMEAKITSGQSKQVIKV